MTAPLQQILFMARTFGAPPLDGLSPTGAWSSFRRLLTSYTGSFYASSGSPTRVTTLNDQSGNSRNLASASGHATPLLATASGLPSMLFGSGDPSPGELLQSSVAMSNFITASDGYMIASLSINTFASAPVIFGDQSLNAFVQNAATPSRIIFNNNGQNVTSSTLSTGTPYVIEWWHTGGTLFARVNLGPTLSVTSGNTSSLSDNLDLGGRFLSSTTDGYFWEFATFSTVPSSANRDLIAQAFMRAIGATIPAPILSSPTYTFTSSTAATLGVTSDQGYGTIYVIADINSSTPSAAQIIAGQNAAGSAAAYASSAAAVAGANSFNATGLPSNTDVYVWFTQVRADAPDVTPVSVHALTPANAFLARTSGLDSTHTTAYTNLINDLVSNNIWSKLDVLHIYATDTSTNALLNLVSTSFNGTANGSPTFTADRGFTGVNGSSSVYIDTGFNSTTASNPKFTLNSAHVSAWSNTNATSGPTGGIIIGIEGSSNTNRVLIFPKYNDGNFYLDVNGSANTSSISGSSSNSTGHFLINRSASNAQQAYRNNSSLGTNTAASGTLVNGTMLVLAQRVNGSPAAGGAYQITMASIGSSLSSTDVTNFYNALRTYMTAVGVP